MELIDYILRPTNQQAKIITKYDDEVAVATISSIFNVITAS